MRYTFLFKIAIVFVTLTFSINKCSAQIPAGFSVYTTAAQGGRIQVIFNKIDDIENGITLAYKTILGLTLVDGDGVGGTDYTELYLYASTTDASISSLDGLTTIPLNRLEVICSNAAGFTGIGGLITKETFEPVQSLTGGGTPDLLFETDRPTSEDIKFSTHRVQIEFRVGVSNSLATSPPGYYILNVNFDLVGCGTWGGACP
tara:strand:- start:2888 stop:3496 length:609 start_codon:yes stop_codon:yes gene_type:complete